MSEWLREHDDGRTRCWWPGTDPLYLDYHDTEWGRPVGDDEALYEKLCLDSFQAGLAWITILRKRESFRQAFAGFAVDTVAAFEEPDIERLLGDPGIIRHRGKIVAAINNARATQALLARGGSLAGVLWSFEPTSRAGREPGSDPAQPVAAVTDESVAMSKALKARGFSFVGPTVAYAFMQAVGIVNDHLPGCFVAEEVEAQRRAFVRPAAPA